ncbi:zinc finger CCCH domain-containing protein 66-like isoform X2 [Phoenix dactylifera]|uniref:Zinc finger CCCH domain-containing protein 66-like isoform X2 n=1 Tax=Phoenix dactylifera TaxID=42345 RepID=A0A8B8ZR67_PHODC|nr:zinc finger CCCH domain-containing protein 66-like isoform X2 [Phoenix dactylifera]
MPDTRPVQSNAVANSSNACPDNLGAMWQLKIEDCRGGADAIPNLYPDRPGEPDCIYYLRTGYCGYGSNCRYNHPNYIGQGTLYTGVLPERDGQPDCQFFLKTGTCKFGVTCKYHHPRDNHEVRQVQLNILGLPMRKDEKSCPYYMKTGLCKFGIACKFNHPQPTTHAAMLPVTGPSAYGSTGSSVATPSGLPLIAGLSAWSLSTIACMSNPRMQGLPYMSLVLPLTQGTMPVQQGWSTYMGGVNHVPSTDVAGPKQISYPKHHALLGSSAPVDFPERPDQPQCQYYMKTGSCKFGTSCKFHHPKERNQEAICTIGPLGLPLRPGQPLCTFYSMYGSCKYGSTCKFDHPFMGYNYTLPAFSVPDPPVLFPNRRNSQAMRMLAEDSDSKTVRLPDQHVKYETSDEPQDANDHNHGNSSTQVSPSHTARHSESPGKCSD